MENGEQTPNQKIFVRKVLSPITFDTNSGCFFSQTGSIKNVKLMTWKKTKAKSD